MSGLRKWWRKHFLGAELAASLVAAALFFVWIYIAGGSETADLVLRDNRNSLYGTLATLFGSLFGFSITAASIVLGASSSPSLEIVRKSDHYGDIGKVLSNTIVTLGFATLAALVGLLADRDGAPSHIALCIVALALLLSCLRAARTVWVLRYVMRLVFKSAGN